MSTPRARSSCVARLHRLFRRLPRRLWPVLGLVIGLVGMGSHARPVQAASPAAPLSVDAVSVALEIHPGGSELADGSDVPRRGAWVVGRATYRLSRPAEAGDELVLLDFSGFLQKDPAKELDEIAYATYVAGGPFDAGSTTVAETQGVQSLKRRGPRRDLVIEPHVGATELTLEYRIDVPHRYWPFGCVQKRCSLSGALAPLPSTRARGGRWLPQGRVVAPARWTVERAALVTAPGEDPPRGEVVVVGGEPDRARHYPSVFWGPPWHRTESIHRGVRVTVLHTRPRPWAQVPHETFVQLRRDLPGHVLQIARQVVDVLRSVDRPPPIDTRVIVVQGPLRSQVAEAHPDLVMLSDQALEILPAARFMKFHEEAIARALLDDLVERSFRGRHDPSTDLWLPGMVSFALLGVWHHARALRDEFAPDILRNFTFVPAVDRFLYTQQASFSQAYFRGVEDAPPLRNHPRWFAHELPTGRRIHGKLTDTLGPERLDAFYRSITADPDTDPIRAASRAYGHTLGWFFDQWLGPYPSVDYAIADVKSEPVGDRFRHEITIEQNGQVPVVEPVQVYVVERGGKTHHLVWNGQLDPSAERLVDEPTRGTHTWVVEGDSRIRTVWIDPRSRLVQTPQPPHENVDPRFNDRDPPAFRFLYTGVGLSIAASEFVNANTPVARFNAITGFAAFASSLRRDLRRTGYLQVSRDRETNIALGAGANFWFGRKVNQQMRRARVRLGATGSWLNDRSLDPRGGVRLVETISLIDDTRRFSWWPERGRWLSASLGVRQVLRVDEGPSDTVHDLIPAASWIQLWRVAHDHVIATSLAASFVIPITGTEEFRSLTRAGGIGGLSGYVADEIFGKGTALLQAEYRHVYLNDLHLNVLHLGYLRSISGTLMTGVASASSCDDLSGWFGEDSWYAAVGYALNAHFFVFGVTPQLFRVEASVPLVRRRGVQCLGRTMPDYLAEVQGLENAARLLPPFNINVVFQQTF